MLADRGIQVFGWDQRGWGRSPKTKAEYGRTGTTDRVLKDVAAFIRDKLPSEVPVFVMGHSMGGGEVITLAADPQYHDVVKQVRGWMLVAPYIGFAEGTEPSWLKVFLGRLTGRFLPHRQMKFPIAPEAVTSEPAAIEELRNDPLIHYTGTLEGLASLLDRTTLLSSGNIKMGDNVKSLWIGMAANEVVVSNPKTNVWADAQTTADKTVKTYEGKKHQLFRETGNDEILGDIAKWILQRSEGEGAQAKL